MSRIARPRLVTFDVTGTLLSTKLAEHYTKIASQHGIAVSNQQQLARSFVDNFKRLEREHPVFGRHTGLGWENWWRQMVYNVFKDQDNSISSESLDKIATSLIRCYGTKKCWHRYPGVVEILDYLHSRDVVLGVISNFDERLEAILTSVGIRRYFSFVLSSYAHGTEKPDRSIFEKALRMASDARKTDFKPEAAMHVGDTPERDYAGAIGAGWNAALVNHRNLSIEENKVPLARQFTNLRQLQDQFQIIFDTKNDRRLF